jgi:hypothetical protein
MSQWFEDLKTYLPKYLSAEGQANLFAELSQFPNNIDRRLYTLRLLNEMNVFQGDGLARSPTQSGQMRTAGLMGNPQLRGATRYRGVPLVTFATREWQNKAALVFTPR